MSADSVPTPAFQAFHFTDVDEFKRAVRKYRVDFTPLARKISVQQSILNLADFDVVVVRSFPRMADTVLAPDCTAIGITMDDDSLVRFNGVDVDRPMIGIGHGGHQFSILERTGGRLAAINFTPEIHDRGWPEPSLHFSMFVTAMPELQKLRLVVSEILKSVSVSMDALSVPATVAGMKESLLAAIDQAFEAGKLPKSARSLHSVRAFTILQKIEAVLAEDLRKPIYSSELAIAVGVSVRTLHDVIMQFRGMSLHRYLRVKRLWLVRRRLLAGEISVKACALEYGFWHLSDFSTSYRSHFGETPSETLANARVI
jgi:AraC-like DNA-binding protein